MNAPRIVLYPALLLAFAAAPGSAGTPDAAPETPPTPAAAPETPPTPPAAPGPALTAEALYVVVHASRAEEAIDRDWLRSVYLGKRRHWADGSPLKAVNRKADEPAAAALFDGVLDMSASAFRRYWQKRELSGRGVMPPTATTAEGLLRLVAGRPEVTGYVLGAEVSTPPERLRFVEVKP